MLLNVESEKKLKGKKFENRDCRFCWCGFCFF